MTKFDDIADDFINKVRSSDIQRATTVEAIIVYVLNDDKHTHRQDFTTTSKAHFGADEPFAVFVVQQHKEAIISNINSMIRNLPSMLPPQSVFVSATLEIVHP